MIPCFTLSRLCKVHFAVFPTRIKRWLRISIRTMFVLTTILCVGLGLIVQRVERQKEVVKWVEGLGGRVDYDYELDGFGFALPGTAPGPKWLRELVGVDYFAAIDFVDLSNTTVRDISPLASLPGLRNARLNDTNVDDLSPLKDLTGLQVLAVSNTRVVDLSPLTSLSDLESLSLSNTEVRDLSPLAGLAALRILDIHLTPVSDVSPLVNLATLELLLLDESSVAAAGQARLKKALPNCAILDPSVAVDLSVTEVLSE